MKGRAIITKSARYNIRKKVLMNKRKFKGTNISVTESLTSLRMAKLKDTRDFFHLFRSNYIKIYSGIQR